MNMIKTYSDLIKLPSFEERFKYLKQTASVGVETFGFDRYLNQILYSSYKWKKLRDQIIIRDHGCDLGVLGYDINSKPLIHHINPITIMNIVNNDDMVWDPENLITTTYTTHRYIHYGTENTPPNTFVERSEGDTTLWRKKE